MQHSLWRLRQNNGSYRFQRSHYIMAVPRSLHGRDERAEQSVIRGLVSRRRGYQGERCNRGTLRVLPIAVSVATAGYLPAEVAQSK